MGILFKGSAECTEFGGGSMRIEEYLSTLTEQMRCRKARGAVEEELRQHMEEQKQYFADAGMEEQEAEVAAVGDMGDPVEAGIALDRIHRPKMAWGMIGFILVLQIVGAGIQYLLSLQSTEGSYIGGGLVGQLVFVGLGFVVMLAVCFADYSRIGRWAKEITVVMTVGIVVGRMLIGRQINGSRLWLGMGGININILMVLLLFLPLYGAVVYSYRNEGYKGFFKSMLWMAPSIMIGITSPSTVGTLILVFSMVITISTAIYKGWFRISRKVTLTLLWCSVTMVPVIMAVGLWLFGAPYQSARIQGLVGKGEPGYPVRMIREALGGSRLLGKGDTPDMLLSTDFLLVFVGTYWGLLAAVLLVGGVAILLVRFLRITLKQKNQLGMIMGVGCVSVLFTCLLFYVLGNTGVLPNSYYYCPFFTGGGSAVMATSILMGLMLSIYRYQNVISETSIRKGWDRTEKRNGRSA